MGVEQVVDEGFVVRVQPDGNGLRGVVAGGDDEMADVGRWSLVVGVGERDQDAVDVEQEVGQSHGCLLAVRPVGWAVMIRQLGLVVGGRMCWSSTVNP